jgi:hypothetical protein
MADAVLFDPYIKRRKSCFSSVSGNEWQKQPGWRVWATDNRKFGISVFARIPGRPRLIHRHRIKPDILCPIHKFSQLFPAMRLCETRYGLDGYTKPP